MADTPKRILTPGGYRPADRVVKVEPDQAVDLSEGKVKVVHRKTGKVVRDFGPRDKQRRSPMSGPRKPPIPSPVSSGWNIYATWVNETTDLLNLMRTTWTVPPEPTTSNGQTIFLFPGLQDNLGDNILQPVLQWGISAAGGGDYWSIASWYIGVEGTFYTTLVTVSPGDVLTGVMTSTGGTFDYNCIFDGVGATNLDVMGVDELIAAYETLETYAVTARSDYPATAYTRFSAIKVTTDASTPSLAWVPVDALPNFGQIAVVRSNANPSGVVDLTYESIAAGGSAISLPSGTRLFSDTLVSRFSQFFNGTTWVWVYVTPHATCALVDAIQGAGSVNGRTAGAPLYASWLHDRHVSAFSLNGGDDIDPFHSFFWWGIVDGFLQLEVFDGRTAGVGGLTNLTITSSARIPTYTWTLVAFKSSWANTNGAIGTYTQYVNGVSVGSGTTNANTTAGTGSFWLDVASLSIGVSKDNYHPSVGTVRMRRLYAASTGWTAGQLAAEYASPCAPILVPDKYQYVLATSTDFDDLVNGPAADLSVDAGAPTTSATDPCTTVMETISPTPNIITSTPCCDTSPGGIATGPILPPTSTAWFPRCVGGGLVPTQADLTDSEDWRI